MCVRDVVFVLFHFVKQESRRSSIYLRSAAIAGQRLQALWCAPVRSLPCTGLRSVPCSSFSAETAGGFLVSRWSLAATSRTSPRLSRRRIRVEHPIADLLRWSGADEARLFARAIVFGIGTSAPQPHLVVSANNVDQPWCRDWGALRSGGQPASQPSASFAWPQGREVWYNVISLKKQTQTFFVLFRRKPLSPTFFFFFRDSFTVKKELRRRS